MRIRPAVQIVELSIGFVEQVGEQEAMAYATRGLADDWIVTGPRGGHYLAPSAQPTVWTLDKQMFFGPFYRVLGRRSESHYIRPVVAARLSS